MPKKKLPSLYRRKWLNKKEGTAYAVISCSVEDWERPRKGYVQYTADVTVDLKDCNRQISLEFYYNDKKSYKQRLEKMDLLIGELQAAKAFMIANPPYEEKIPPKKAKAKVEEMKKASTSVFNASDYLE